MNFWPTDTEAEPELSDKEKALRNAFVRFYLENYDPVAAAIKLGYKAGIANTYATRFMEEPYVLRKIAECEGHGSNDLQVIKRGLVREANYRGAGSSHSARVSALTQLSKIEGMEKAPIGDRTALNGAVLHITPDDLSKLDDEELDVMVRIFSKLNVQVATMPQVA